MSLASGFDLVSEEGLELGLDLPKKDFVLVSLCKGGSEMESWEVVSGREAVECVRLEAALNSVLSLRDESVVLSEDMLPSLPLTTRSNTTHSASHCLEG